MNEYLYGDTLRWGFGFDNPNKAAVIFAGLLPVAWWAWAASWGIRREGPRISALVVSAVLFLATGTCLIMTFSRGGLVAGLAALGYCLWKFRSPGWRDGLRVPAFWLSVFLILTLVCLAVWSGLANRSASAIGDDASVTNRLDLWRAGLQMAFENPAGFGSGRSGVEFMQWYQAPGRTEGYRTMVNSHLTFLVERGWAALGFSWVLLIVFWQWSVPRGDHIRLIMTLKASLLAFLVAGVFSTTMENYWLWIIPALCALGIIATVRDRPKWKPILVSSLSLTIVALGILWVFGWHCSSRDPIVRRFEFRDSLVKVVGVSSRAPTSFIQLLPDPIVLGEQYGKLARILASKANARVEIDGMLSADLILASGKKCFEEKIAGHRLVILIAPPIPSESVAAGILESCAHKILLLPEIDEDGRSNWWKKREKQCARMVPLEGVGTRVDWAWDAIIETAKEQLFVKN